MSGTKRKLQDRDGWDTVVEGHQELVTKSLKLAQNEATTSIEEPQNHTLANWDLGLPTLSDFSALTTVEEISQRFSAVAHELLSNSILSIVRNGVRTDLDILEIEFYLQKSGCHEDPFTHGSVEQERSGQWYFHRSPRRVDTAAQGLPVSAAGSYRGGTRKGLDLTIGGPVASQSPTGPVTIRGGVLLRTVRLRADNKVICGPSLLVDEILRLSEAPTIDHLVNTAWNGDIFALAPPASPRSTFMYLHPSPGGPDVHLPIVYRSPRIGLDLSNPDTTESVVHPRVAFVGKPYRYFTHPELLAYKGRVQTFVGLCDMLMESKGYAEGSMELKKALGNMLRLGEQNVSKYMADYRSGYQFGKLRPFVGRAGKGVCQSTSEYLRMMGALRRALQLHDSE